jgi:hypothetical protein
MASTAQLEDKIDAILEQQGVILEALQGSLRPGAAPGLLQRMNASEADRADLRRIVGELLLAVRTLETTPGRVALSWLERVALAVISLALAGLGALVGRVAAGGQHP